MSAWASPRMSPTASRTIISPSMAPKQLGSDIDVGELIAICVAENDRRLAPYDDRLKRPRFVPFMARLALKFIGPKKKAACMKIGSHGTSRHLLQPFHADLYRVRSRHAALAGAGRGGAAAPEIRAFLGRGFLYRAPGRGDRRRLHRNHQRSGAEGSGGAAGLRGSPPRQDDPGDDREIRHRRRRTPAGRRLRQCRNPLQGFRLRRMHGFLPGLRRLQDRHAVGISAQGDVRHLRNPDVRGNPPHRLLRQLDGLYPGAQGLSRPPDAAVHQLPLLHARAGPHGRHRQARQGTE